MSFSIPESTIIVSLTALGLGLASNIATRLLVDLKKERRLKKEVADFDKELKDAIAKKDKQKEEKLKKKKPQMDQMRLKASTGRLKVTIITWVPFIILYYLMASVVGGYYSPVACSPIPIPFIASSAATSCSAGLPGFQMPLLWWYMISSVAFSSILTKLMGTAN